MQSVSPGNQLSKSGKPRSRNIFPIGLSGVFFSILVLGGLTSCDQKKENDETSAMMGLLLATQPTSTATSTSTSTSTSTVAPSGLSYSSSTVTYTAGSAISTNSPTLTSGTATSWSVSPSLPTGLSLDSSSGAITGTPTYTQSQTSYTVTATNSAGSTTATLKFTVDPSGLILYNASNSTTGFTGNLGGRSGADSKCSSEKPSSLTQCTRIRALITVDSSDTISSMPTNYSVPSGIPVYANSLSGTKMYSTFSGSTSTALAAFTSTSAYTSLKTAGIMPTDTSRMYVALGRTSSGGVSSCSTWSSSSAATSVDLVDGSTGGLWNTPEAGTCDGKDAGLNYWSIICVCY